jgi:Tol biopolymer transport system component/tRNA A-37 threonylcarbamoyl transferase component Bud32
MGEVYLAQDTALRRPVAIKVLKEGLSNNKEYWHRFKREARAVSALNHPNILTIYEMEQWDGRPYIVTEFINGITLRSHFKEGLKEMCEALDIAMQIASALISAHKAGIIHRDIKPENVMVREDGFIKVLDFGLAKLAEDIRSDLSVPARPLVGEETTVSLHTDSRAVVGTVSYMSPEQLRGHALDGSTDVWSLGIVLYEMIAMHSPFDRPTESDKIAAVLERDPPPLERYVPNAPAELQWVVEKCLAKDREGRYRTAQELYEDLKGLKRKLELAPQDVAWRPLSPDRRGAEGDRSRNTIKQRGPAPTGARTGRLERLTGGRRAWLWAALLGSTLLAATAGLLAYGYLSRMARGAPDSRIDQKTGAVNLTNSGTAVLGTISPDGRYIAYIQESGESQTLSVRGVNTGDYVTLAPPGRFKYAGVTFSPDGDYVYYVRYEGNDVGRLYQMPLIGGGAKLLLTGVDSPVSFSPDSRSMAFVRLDKTGGEHRLMVAGVDGTGERMVATRRKGERFSARGAAWSPGGHSLVYGVGSWEGGFHTDLVEASFEGGAEKVIASRRWFSVWQVAWRGESELLVNASVGAAGPVQIWKVSYPGGAVERVTNDLNDYIGISLSGDTGTLVTVQNNRTKTIWVVPSDDTRRERQIATAAGASYGIAWTPDSRIIFSSMAGSSLNLSAINADGSGRRQLTAGAGDNYHPSVSRDGRFIIFASNRTGAFNIWRMNAQDGSQPTQLTNGGADFYPYCSPDGEWVYYEHQSNGVSTLWRVPLGGGPASELTQKYASVPSVSPDGALIACRYYVEGETKGIAVIPAAGGEPVRLLRIPVMNWQRVRWSSDGHALTYIGEQDGTYNLWSQPLKGGLPSRVTDLKGEEIFSYDWSPDFKLLACERGVEISDVVLLEER